MERQVAAEVCCPFLALRHTHAYHCYLLAVNESQLKQGYQLELTSVYWSCIQESFPSLPCLLFYVSFHFFLRKIATQSEALRFSALLDTGALITGLTNQQVAAFLLDEGLTGCDGVVLLDDFDRKMVLVRATRRVVELEQCGIQPNKLFAVYDQIHTTGTDLPFLSTFNARAVQTLGKYMVWRDYVQGAWRMRRLGRGHSIHLFIIPEVYETVQREISLARCPELAKAAKSLASSANREVSRGVLRAVAAWLVIDAMRSEKTQVRRRKKTQFAVCRSMDVCQFGLYHRGCHVSKQSAGVFVSCLGLRSLHLGQNMSASVSDCRYCICHPLVLFTHALCALFLS